MSDAATDTIDAFQRGAFRLVQGRTGHRSGMDALLLASLVVDGAKGRLADLGAGSGAVAFSVLARCADVAAVLVERDARACERAREGIALNDFGARAQVVQGDVTLRSAEREALGFGNDGFDLVVSNPPFNGAGHRRSPDGSRAAAHVAVALEEWVRVANLLLRSGGRGAFIARPADLAAFTALDGLVVRPVHPKRDEAASRILVAWRKGTRAATAIAPPLVVHAADGSFTQEAAAIFG